MRQPRADSRDSTPCEKTWQLALHADRNDRNLSCPRHLRYIFDLSPGNLACDAVDGGRIIFYDFGMMDQLTMPLKRGLVNLIFGIYGNDVKEVVDSLEEMDVIRKVLDIPFPPSLFMRLGTRALSFRDCHVA